MQATRSRPAERGGGLIGARSLTPTTQQWHAAQRQAARVGEARAHADQHAGTQQQSSNVSSVAKLPLSYSAALLHSCEASASGTRAVSSSRPLSPASLRSLSSSVSSRLHPSDSMSLSAMSLETSCMGDGAFSSHTHTPCSVGSEASTPRASSRSQDVSPPVSNDADAERRERAQTNALLPANANMRKEGAMAAADAFPALSGVTPTAPLIAASSLKGAWGRAPPKLLVGVESGQRTPVQPSTPRAKETADEVAHADDAVTPVQQQQQEEAVVPKPTLPVAVDESASPRALLSPTRVAPSPSSRVPKPPSSTSASFQTGSDASLLSSASAMAQEEANALCAALQARESSGKRLRRRGRKATLPKLSIDRLAAENAAADERVCDSMRNGMDAASISSSSLSRSRSPVAEGHAGVSSSSGLVASSSECATAASSSTHALTLTPAPSTHSHASPTESSHTRRLPMKKGGSNTRTPVLRIGASSAASLPSSSGTCSPLPMPSALPLHKSASARSLTHMRGASSSRHERSDRSAMHTYTPMMLHQYTGPPQPYTGPHFIATQAAPAHQSASAAGLSSPLSAPAAFSTSPLPVPLPASPYMLPFVVSPAAASLPVSVGGVPRLEALKLQLEFYFSAANLSRDTYLRTLMNSRGYVRVSRLLEFNRVRALTLTTSELLTAAHCSQHLHTRRGRVRSKTEWFKFIAQPITAQQASETQTDDDDDDEEESTEVQQQQQPSAVSQEQQQPQIPATGDVPVESVMQPVFYVATPIFAYYPMPAMMPVHAAVSPSSLSPAGAAAISPLPLYVVAPPPPPSSLPAPASSPHMYMQRQAPPAARPRSVRKAKGTMQTDASGAASPAPSEAEASPQQEPRTHALRSYRSAPAAAAQQQ